MSDTWDGCTVEAGAGSYPEPPAEQTESEPVACDRCGWTDMDRVYHFGGEKLCWECWDEAIRETAHKASFEDMHDFIFEDKFREGPYESRWGDFFRHWCYESIPPWVQALMIEQFLAKNQTELLKEMRRYVTQDFDAMREIAEWMDKHGRLTA